jgi:hypothetical protein
MKNLLFVFTLFLGFQLFTDDIRTQNFIVNSDAAAVAEADTSNIITSWNDGFIFDNSFDECAPVQNLEDPGIKIFIPDSSLTNSMPILFPPPFDEGIFINYLPYCGEAVDDQVPDHDEEKEEQK